MKKEIINTSKAPAAIGPYSQGVKVGNFVFTSGQVGFLPETGKMVEGGVQAQTKRCLENIKAVLKAADTSMENVVKATIFIKEISDFGKVNEIYAEYFTDKKPARACVEVAKLPADALVEIEVIAILPE